jgi:hypothetical protein
MMELAVLAKASLIVTMIIRSGYTIAVGYLVKTGYNYVQDYKESVEQEKLFADK